MRSKSETSFDLYDYLLRWTMGSRVSFIRATTGAGTSPL